MVYEQGSEDGDEGSSMAWRRVLKDDEGVGGHADDMQPFLPGCVGWNVMEGGVLIVYVHARAGTE